jgi:hypothetical protein
MKFQRKSNLVLRPWRHQWESRNQDPGLPPTTRVSHCTAIHSLNTLLDFRRELHSTIGWLVMEFTKCRVVEAILTLKSPLWSSADQGAITFSPGTELYHAPKHCECCAPVCKLSLHVLSCTHL